jgi:hypothetical protein
MRNSQGKTAFILGLTLWGLSTWDFAIAEEPAGIATVVGRTSHRASSFDHSGGNSDAINGLAPKEKLVLLDTDGPGIINHIWTTESAFPGHDAMLRDLAIRIYWENSSVPSVEAPLGDFFGLGHGKLYQVHAQTIHVGESTKALNCYWPMPFYKHARVEIVNLGEQSIRKIFYNIDYELGPIPPKQGLFHAEFRRVKKLLPQPLVGNTTGKDNYVILDTEGEGQYVGCFLFVDSARGGWWGEGDDMMFIDGEKTPSIIGTGTEDYFCNAWGFHATYNFPYYGIPLLEKQPDGWTQTTAYRLHIPDPVRFKKSLKVTIEHGWGGKAAYDYSSVAYWYQLQPVARRAPLSAATENQPRSHAARTPEKPASKSVSATTFEPALRAQGVKVRGFTTARGESLAGGILQIDSPGKPVNIPIPVVPGKYRIAVKLHDIGIAEPVTIGLQHGAPKTLEKVSGKQPMIELGTVEVGKNQPLTLTAQSPGVFALDFVKLQLE